VSFDAREYLKDEITDDLERVGAFLILYASNRKTEEVFEEAG
jgi:hypothetical protein